MNKLIREAINKTSSMKVYFHSVNFAADVKLLDFAQKKIDKLDVFYDNVINGDVYFKIDSSSNNDNKLVEIMLRVPGKELVVKKYSNSFEAAVHQSIDALSRALLKYKAKLNSLL